jgi:hypothetical protein
MDYYNEYIYYFATTAEDMVVCQSTDMIAAEITMVATELTNYSELPQIFPVPHIDNFYDAIDWLETTIPRSLSSDLPSKHDLDFI